jgi:hypothetical protein
VNEFGSGIPSPFRNVTYWLLAGGDSRPITCGIHGPKYVGQPIREYNESGIFGNSHYLYEKGSERRLGKDMTPSEETTERIRLLSLVDIFEPLSTGEIEQLNGQLSDIHLDPGEIFYTPHDRSERLFLLWKGRVRII